jgi:hypothetical protein
MCASGLPVRRNREQNVLQPALRRCKRRDRDLLRLRTSGLLAVLVELDPRSAKGTRRQTEQGTREFLRNDRIGAESQTVS